MRLFKTIYNHLLDSLFPPFCCHCSWPFTFLCSRCYEHINFLPGSPQIKLDPLYLDKMIVTGYFDGPLKSLLFSLKYQGQVEVAITLGKLLYHTTALPPADIISWVPAHPIRLKHRKYNQSALIAHQLAQEMNVPTAALLQRTTVLAPQASISDRAERVQRQQNTMSLAKTTIQIQGATILIIDDVFTTGATINEAARVLKSNGAQKIIGVALAQGT